MLTNEYLVEKIGFDTAENGQSKVLGDTTLFVFFGGGGGGRGGL